MLGGRTSLPTCVSNLPLSQSCQSHLSCLAKRRTFSCINTTNDYQIAAQDRRRRSFFFRFQKAERPKDGPNDRDHPGPALPEGSYSLLILAY